MSSQSLFRMDGKTAVITGGSSGLGVAFATGFAEAGADIVICARRADRLAETADAVEDLGRRCLAVSCDVTIVEDCDRAIAEALETFGKVDTLINNAGVASAHPALREAPEDFRHVIDVNLMGSYWMAQACGRVMTPGSSVINIGSVLGATTAGLPQAAYCSSKAAIVGLTRDLAQQWAQRAGIRVNALAPGYFPTEINEDLTAAYWGSILARIPAGRLGVGRELAAAAVFLASDAASYITGIVLPVDGGLLTN